MEEINSKIIPSSPLTLDEPPPPYVADLSVTNPGFCAEAFRERQSNRIPGGGRTAAEYSQPCKACSVVCGDQIPGTFYNNWPEWVDPSVNFRWESHTGIAAINGEKKELLGCWICWEYEQKWVKPMLAEEWYEHTKKHFKGDGYRVCKGKKGGMQRRRNCAVIGCPKIHCPYPVCFIYNCFSDFSLVCHPFHVVHTNVLKLNQEREGESLSAMSRLD
jgi:hypothetical protein